MKRGFDSVALVVEEEKQAMSISIQTSHGWARPGPVPAFKPRTKGRMAHSLRLASWKAGTPVSFETHSLGTCPQGWRLFLRYFLWHNTRLKAVEWLPVPSLRTIADTLANTVTFLRKALRLATRTLFSSQGTTDLFFLSEQKVEMLPARVKTWRETFLPAGTGSPAACGGFSVIESFNRAL
jgi:hypothetical protein